MFQQRGHFSPAASRRASVIEVLGGALIVAGGLGNALDRFTLGYVVETMVSPTATACFLETVAPFTNTRPSSIARAAAEREA